MIINYVSALILSGKFRFLLLAISGIITYKFLGNLLVTDTVFIVTGLIALAYSYKLVNIYSAILIILVMRIVEILLRDKLGAIHPYTYYLSYAIIDAGVVFLLVIKFWVIHLFRRTFTGNLSVEDLEMTTADLTLLIIYSMYFLLSLVMAFEHFMRHLDDIPIILNGVYALVSTISPNSFINADELASHLNKHADFFYNSYPVLKPPFNILEHIVILATSLQSMRKKSPFIT